MKPSLCILNCCLSVRLCCIMASIVSHRELRTSIYNMNPAMQEGIKKQSEVKVSPSEIFPVLVAEMIHIIRTQIQFNG